MSRDYKDIERRLLLGEKVTTPELIDARRLFRELRTNLLELGPHWHFAFVEANRLEMLCNSYLNARGEK